ncbi:MAG: hypothetical protein RDU20_15760 [Desulfomonilaceae bacterium]|nr:hypothetical protein [Desulfomonilaceae bacterium]
MDEGVDPQQMCQGLLDKIGRSEQLRSVAHPELLILFEDWLEELEEEAIAAVRRIGSKNPMDLATELGLSSSGTTFLVAKLNREDKI